MRRVVSVVPAFLALSLALTTTNIGLPATPRVDVADGNANMVLVSWNALDHFDGASAQQIFGTLGADVALLPELQNHGGGAAGNSRIEVALAEGGLGSRDFDIFESPPTGTHIAPLTVIVRKGPDSRRSSPCTQLHPCPDGWPSGGAT